MNKKIMPAAVAVIVATVVLTSCGGSGPEEAVEAGGEIRTVNTYRGEVKVPASPQKIVVLGIQLAGMLESLDVEYSAVGGYYAQADGFRSCYPWLSDTVLDKIDEDLVAQTDVNVEAVAAQKPDLILATSYMGRDDATYEQLSAIAPVVLPEDGAMNPDWNAVYSTMAEAVGKTEVAEKIVAEVTAKYAETQIKYPEVAGKTYQFFGATDDGYMMGNGSPLKLIGMEPGRYHTDEHQNGTTFSWEKMGDLDADLLAVYDPTGQWWDKLQDDARFAELPAVESGNTYRTDLAVACAVNSSDPIGLEWFLDNHISQWAAKLDSTSGSEAASAGSGSSSTS